MSKRNPSQINRTMANVLAAFMPKRSIPLCPKCKAQLHCTFTVYVHAPVILESYPTDGLARLEATDRLAETLDDIKKQLREDGGQELSDWRTELHCSKSCGYWTTVEKLEKGEENG